MDDRKTATLILEYDVRFDHDYPSFSVSLLKSNANVDVIDFYATPFGAKFKIKPRGDKEQLVSGSMQIKNDKNKNDSETFYIFGKALHKGKESKLEETVNELASSENIIEFDSKWIQSRSTADNILSWMVERMRDDHFELSADIVGNPFIEVGDIITIRHTDLRLDDSVRFVVKAVKLSWSDGLTTSIVAVDI